MIEDDCGFSVGPWSMFLLGFSFFKCDWVPWLWIVDNQEKSLSQVKMKNTFKENFPLSNALLQKDFFFYNIFSTDNNL